VKLARHFSDGVGVGTRCKASRIEEDSQSPEDVSKSCRILDMVLKDRCEFNDDEDVDKEGMLDENEASVARRFPAIIFKLSSWSELSVVV
jgi:hypothetical protein